MPTIQLPDSPSIPGLSFRNFAGESDYEKMVGVFEHSREFENFDWAMKAEDVENDLTHTSNFDLTQDLLVAEIDGEMIAYSYNWWNEQLDGDFVYNFIGLLEPRWRRKGIGTAMIRHAERRLHQIAQGHPTEARKYYQRGVVDTEIGLEALLRKESYEPVRYHYTMTRPISLPIPEAPMPEGVEVRPATVDQARTILQAVFEAFKDSWGAGQFTENDIQAIMSQSTFDPSIWMVGWDGDQVAGNVLNYLDEEENVKYGRKRGYTEGISVGRPWRKRGLARALLVRSIQMFKEMGMEETCLGVDTQNPHGALQLYEGVGYQVVRRFSVYRKPLVLEI